ncbi:MAG TPA: hypothetical protein VJN18_30230 [Polyangiaceae bacterium]|nr:hypothetical protein [Polyangiaceae bacterium]
MQRAWLWLLLSCASCSSDDDTVKETYGYSDSNGRACQATLEKTSPGAPSINQSVSCDGEPKSCSAESEPCFVLSVDSDTDAIRNCPACCKGNSSSFVGRECSIVVCQTATDCVFAKATCATGSCNCPSGNCE